MQEVVNYVSDGDIALLSDIDNGNIRIGGQCLQWHDLVWRVVETNIDKEIDAVRKGKLKPKLRTAQLLRTLVSKADGRGPKLHATVGKLLQHLIFILREPQTFGVYHSEYLRILSERYFLIKLF